MTDWREEYSQLASRKANEIAELRDELQRVYEVNSTNAALVREREQERDEARTVACKAVRSLSVDPELQIEIWAERWPWLKETQTNG